MRDVSGRTKDFPRCIKDFPGCPEPSGGYTNGQQRSRTWKWCRGAGKNDSAALFLAGK